jgi:hypothetical protein
LIVSALFVQIAINAQNNTNSPYARYGYGVLADQAFGNQRAMGGIGYGFRDPKTINPLNPASFSGVDSMTFMFDMGVSGVMGWFNEQGNKDSKFNGGLEYVAMQFPLYKDLGVGLGFKPVSYVGYEYQSTYSDPDVYTQIYSGSGGVNQLYAALSYNFFKRFSVGINAGYMFGDVAHVRSTVYSDATSYNTILADTLRTSGLLVDFGFQYVHPLNKTTRIIVGGVYTPKTKLNEKVMETALVYIDNSVQNISRTASHDYDFEMPQSIGLGVSYAKLNKFTIGTDVLMQKWSDASFYSKKDTLADRMRLSIGGDFVINPMSRNYLQRMHFRAGGHYSDSYIRIKGSEYKEYGVSLGIGIPMIDNRSYLNLSFEYMALNPGAAPVGTTLINEKYFKFTLSYTFNEWWFFKRKVQ